MTYAPSIDDENVPSITCVGAIASPPHGGIAKAGAAARPTRSIQNARMPRA
jgi:hypothetical protein